MKVQPMPVWAVVDSKGNIFAIRHSRDAAEKFARGWSNEIADTTDIFGWRGGFTMCAFPQLYVRRARISA